MSFPPLPVVAIDGPVGVGKSSVAEAVAVTMGIRHINTGSMYRAVALAVMESSSQGGATMDDREIAVLAQSLRMEFTAAGALLVDGVDHGDKLRCEGVSRFVSRVADNHDVREALVSQQRRMGSQAPSVLEGRDIGTVVFPDAACKIYLDASPQARLDRRVKQLRKSGKDVDEQAVLSALIERDRRDRERPWGALKLAEDAILLDTTELSMERVVATIVAIAQEHPAFAR